MKKQQTNKLQALNGPPLDFSFKNIRSLNQLLDQTKGTDNLLQNQEQQRKQQLQQKPSPKPNHLQDNTQSTNLQNLNETKFQIIRTIEIPQNKILDLNKNVSKRKQKNEKKPLKFIDSKTSALFLRYNKITSIQGLFTIVGKFFPDINNLIWIDLSFNRLVHLVEDFALFPHLKNIYLHSNYIYDFKQIEKIAKVKQLRSLTIHANPLEKFEQFRVLIAFIIPQLQKIDSTLLTKRQRDRGQVIKMQFKKYPIIKNPQLRHEQSDNQEES